MKCNISDRNTGDCYVTRIARGLYENELQQRFYHTRGQCCPKNTLDLTYSHWGLQGDRALWL